MNRVSKSLLGQHPVSVGAAARVDGARSRSRTWAARRRQGRVLLQQAVVPHQSLRSRQLVLRQPLTNTKLTLLVFTKGMERERRTEYAASDIQQSTFAPLPGD